MSGNHFLQSFGRVHELSDSAAKSFLLFPGVSASVMLAIPGERRPYGPRCVTNVIARKARTPPALVTAIIHSALVTDVLDIISANASGAKADVI